MRPERVAAVVVRWARLYTRGLQPDVAERRIEELTADLHDQIAHERAAGVGDRRVARAVAARALRGVPSDLAWRRPKAPLRVALFVAAVLAVPAVGMLVSDQVVWSAADFVLAGVLLTIVASAFELALRRSGNLPAAAALAALGVAACLLGEADDAPGLVLLGLLLLASACAIVARRIRRV
jgi:hypothetical protein